MPYLRAAVVVLASTVLPACSIDLGAAQYVQREERSFAVSGPVELSIRTFDGGIDVHAWDEPRVAVTAEKHAESDEAARAMAVRMTQTGNRIELEAQRPAGLMLNISRSVHFTVKVPRGTSLRAESGDGGVTVDGLAGGVDLRTGDGGITVRQIEGALAVRTGDGAVQIDNVRGPVHLTTGDGAVDVSGTLTGLTAHTGDGPMHVRAGQGSRAESDWDITTGDGGVTVELPDGFDARIDAHTGDGGVDVQGLPLPPPSTREGERSTYRGQLGSGGATLRVRTGDGGIVLRHS